MPRSYTMQRVWDIASYGGGGREAPLSSFERRIFYYGSLVYVYYMYGTRKEKSVADWYGIPARHEWP